MGNVENVNVVGRAEWLAARKELLTAEKDFTQLCDDLARQRRNMPWVRVEKDYVFDGPNGPQHLGDLFEGRSQLIVYHFMFAPDAQAGCKSCSFWADHFDATIPHLNARDVTFVAVSRAPRAKLEAQARRLGWRFKWLSCGDGDFNYDFRVSFDPSRAPAEYNYASFKGTNLDMPGFSTFIKGADGAIYHTYSTFGRGIEMANATYNLLDIAPKGRNEEGLPYVMSWVRFHDEYGT